MKKPPKNEAGDIKMSINYLQTTACDILRSSWDKEDPLSRHARFSRNGLSGSKKGIFFSDAK
ncbi:MAG: hypothetical protein DRI89_07360 [Bacteroidetes bacterium]|nr:MAG: hypothetical protein DRI89_07360 [Bacteroidota bacterium]